MDSRQNNQLLEKKQGTVREQVEREDLPPKRSSKNAIQTKN